MEKALDSQADAMVRRAHKGKLFSRRARGFSIGELTKAGMDPTAARRAGLRIDERRKTVYDFNVDLLKKHGITRPSIAKHGSRAAKRETAAREPGEELVETVEATSE